MKKLLCSIFAVISFSSSAMETQDFKFEQKSVKGTVFDGFYGSSYEKIGKKLRLFKFFFMGSSINASGNTEFLYSFHDDADREYHYLIGGDTRPSELIFNDRFCRLECAAILQHRERLKMIQFYQLLVGLERNPERKKTFIEFHATYFDSYCAETAPWKLESFVFGFEKDPAKRAFLLSLHEKRSNTLLIEMSPEESDKEEKEYLASRIK